MPPPLRTTTSTLPPLPAVGWQHEAPPPRAAVVSAPDCCCALRGGHCSRAIIVRLSGLRAAQQRQTICCHMGTQLRAVQLPRQASDSRRAVWRRSQRSVIELHDVMMRWNKSKRRRSPQPSQGPLQPPPPHCRPHGAATRGGAADVVPRHSERPFKGHPRKNLLIKPKIDRRTDRRTARRTLGRSAARDAFGLPARANAAAADPPGTQSNSALRETRRNSRKGKKCEHTKHRHMAG